MSGEQPKTTGNGEIIKNMVSSIKEDNVKLHELVGKALKQIDELTAKMAILITENGKLHASVEKMVLEAAKTPSRSTSSSSSSTTTKKSSAVVNKLPSQEATSNAYLINYLMNNLDVGLSKAKLTREQYEEKIKAIADANPGKTSKSHHTELVKGLFIDTVLKETIKKQWQEDKLNATTGENVREAEPISSIESTADDI